MTFPENGHFGTQNKRYNKAHTKWWYKNMKYRYIVTYHYPTTLPTYHTLLCRKKKHRFLGSVSVWWSEIEIVFYFLGEYSAPTQWKSSSNQFPSKIIPKVDPVSNFIPSLGEKNSILQSLKHTPNLHKIANFHILTALNPRKIYQNKWK